jgi:site-specific recombinase XerD
MEDGGEPIVSRQSVSLSYGTRHEVLAQIAPRYQEATEAQKTLLLDQCVELTGYGRKYIITLLNHVPESKPRILRPRQPIYGSAVQEALFLAWRTIQYPCAQRLVPALPRLISLLERDGHLHLNEEHQRQLLAISVRTAERLLSTLRRPTPHGFSTTKPGTLLKHQIPIRTFAQWDDHRPGFLEADLVAHCGGNVYGGYLYTLTLTDIATGWTECVPLLNRSPETVLAALQRAQSLLPFPLLGLDTDNGGEFINGAMLAYCEREQITFTRSRPECSNDNGHVEQKNGAVVRKIVSYDRLVSTLAYQQLGELYRASRLLVNCFQPSMKLQSKHIEGKNERRMYDEAKTPLQRVLLFSGLPQQQLLELQEAVESLDPLRLVQHVEALQRAVWRCAEGGPGTTLVRFSLSVCVSAATRPSQRKALDVPAPMVLVPAEVRDWSRSMDDPFLGEWEQIYVYVRARPMASAGEILREWQRRFPERFVEAHLSLLQRRLREMRASLVAPQTASPASERKSGTASRKEPQPAQAVASLADTPTVPFVDPVSASSSLLPSPEEETQPVQWSQGAASNVLSSKKELGSQAPSAQTLPVADAADALSPAMMTIDHALSLFFQGKHAEYWESKTREWHETSLGQLQRYVAWRKVLLLTSLTGGEIRGWLTFLRTEALVTGAFRVQSTISTYARSAHAWCAWLVEQEHLEMSPFAQIPFPQGKQRHLRIIEQEVFERMFAACHAPQTKRTTMGYATARNQAILWVLRDTGLLVSEVCSLDLENVDLRQGILHVQGKGSKGRTLPLTPEVQQALTVYLEQYRLLGRKRETSDPLFLSEHRSRLTKNGFTQLFHRLCARAGLEDRCLTPTMLREAFALRFLQTGGQPKALQRLLGLAEGTPIKRYLDAAGVARKSSHHVRNHPQK